ncbi:hypothetical protein V6N13_099514 [Hibiscus sabdariffa]
MEVSALKTSFPRIYGLEVKKSGKVVEFDTKINGRWVWSIDIRRELFTWELNLWEEFRNTINKATSGSGESDNMIWIGTSNGTYTTILYCEKLSTIASTTDRVWKQVWTGLAPPKVEGFLWKVIHGRILTLDELAKRGII